MKLSSLKPRDVLKGGGGTTDNFLIVQYLKTPAPTSKAGYSQEFTEGGGGKIYPATNLN